MVDFGGHRCSIEQYAMLKRCSAKKDLSEWNEWRKNNPEEEVWLQGAALGGGHLKGIDFTKAHCEGAFFRDSHCEGADFWSAHCEGADFTKAHCEGARFWAANCEGARFYSARCEGVRFLYAHCESADFELAHCEGASFVLAHCEGTSFEHAYCEGVKFVRCRCEGTLFNGAHFDAKSSFIGAAIDDATDFSLTDLSCIKIEPGKRAKLEQNIRRKNWQNDKLGGKLLFAEFVQNVWNDFSIDSIKQNCKNYFEKIKSDKRAKTKLITLPVRFFWYMSDYGYSTKRILKWFAFFIFLFAALYTWHSEMLAIGDKPLATGNGVMLFLKMLAFSAATMVTLGFGNINVAVKCGLPDGWGMLAVSLNLMVGYFMLAILVTRLAVLFQTMAPGHVPGKKEPKNKRG